MAHLIDVAAARSAVLEVARPLAPVEVPVLEALRRVLAEDLTSEGDLPPFDSSAMDGYAVPAGRAAELRVVDESRAGHPAQLAVRPGEAIAVSTGAAVPRGPAVAVVPIERTEQGVDGRVSVPETSPGDNIRRTGEDVRTGDRVLGAGAVLGPAELAVATSLGRVAVVCGPRPRVAVVVTGDELVEPGRPLAAGQIRDSNAAALTAQAELAGAQVVARETVPDDHAATVAALRGALERADVVCVSGGVSVGPHDHVKPALAELGVDERFWGVRLKPGKPTWFGTREAQLVFGLPGNPVSAMVVFQLFVRPALRQLAGAAPDDSRATARLDVAVRRDARRDQALRCRLRAAEDGWRVEPTGRQGSHILTSMVEADALAVVPAGAGLLAAGERVSVELLPRC